MYDPDAWARTFNHPGGVTGDGSNIAFGLPAAGATEDNVSRTLTITGNTLTNAFVDGVLVHNFDGTLSSVNISNNTMPAVRRRVCPLAQAFN